MYYNFSALDGCDMQIKSKRSLEVKSKMLLFSERQYYLKKNGRFSTAKLSLEVKSKMSFFSERQNYFEEKNTGCLYSCYGLAISKRGAKLSLQALLKKFDFV